MITLVFNDVMLVLYDNGVSWSLITTLIIFAYGDHALYYCTMI